MGKKPSTNKPAQKKCDTVKNKDGCKPSHLTRATEKKQVEARVTMPSRITIRFTEEQMKKIGEAAKSKGHKPSSYCRNVILGRKVTDISPERRQFRQALVNGGNNLNQLVRHMNQSGANEKDLADVKEVIDWFKQLKTSIN